VPVTTTSEPPTTEAPTTEPPTTEPQSEPEETPTGAEIVETLENLNELTDDQIADLVADIANADLSEAEAEAIVAILNEAPEEVKEAFEEAVNVFSGGFDGYVPTGSTISVGERRTIVAVSGTMAVAAAPRRRT